MPITGAALVAGVAGDPVAHSLSPWLHARWIAAAGLDAAYVPFAPRGEPAFRALVQGFRGGVIRGLNVTAPFKRLALALADEADEAATAAGSANLLLFAPDGGIEARSTDGHGVLTALARRAPTLVPAVPGVAAILGAGGAAAAAAAALIAAGWRVRLVNRTPAAAQTLAATLGCEAAPDAQTALTGATLLINALPVDPGPLPLTPALTVLDMTYRPHRTPLLRAAQAAAATPVHGLDMLIAQAEPSFAAFYGVDPPELAGLREEARRVG